MAAAAIAALNKEQDGRPRTEDLLAHLTSATTLKLPPESEWIKAGTLEKRALAATEVWHPRRVVLTKEFMAVSRVDSDDMLDQMFLSEVEGADRKHTSHAHDTTANVDRSGRIRRRSSSTFPVQHSLLPVPDWQAAQDAATFAVRTSIHGHNAGRAYEFRADSKESCDQWLHKIEETAHIAKRNAVTTVPFLEKLRGALKHTYDSFPVQIIVALLIFFSFLISCVKVELMPEEGTATFKLFENLDIFFTTIFTVEVLINLFGNWFYPFWRVGWNVFDFTIVTASLVSIPLSEVPGLSYLRLLRVFRVVRLFRKLKSLQKIISALTAALIPVANAFLVLSLVTFIYAVIAVHLFEDNPLFQTFSASVFSMFQICTGDSWATTIVRPMFGPTNTEIPHFPTAFFFFSYILVVGTFLLNVVIAVLLDEFISAVQRHKKEQERAREERLAEERRQAGGALDSLFHTLAHASTRAELSSSIRAIYNVLDKDDSGGLSYQEMHAGMRMLHFDPPLHLSEEDFDDLTDGHRLCNAAGELTAEAFEAMIEKGLDSFIQRHLAMKVLEIEQTDASIASLFIMLNQMSRRLAAQKDTGLRRDTGGGEEAGSERIGGKPEPAASENGFHALQGRGKGSRGEERMDRLEEEVRGLHRKMDEHSRKMDRVLRLLEPSGGALGGGDGREDGAGIRHASLPTPSQPLHRAHADSRNSNGEAQHVYVHARELPTPPRPSHNGANHTPPRPGQVVEWRDEEGGRDGLVGGVSVERNRRLLGAEAKVFSDLGYLGSR